VEVASAAAASHSNQVLVVAAANQALVVAAVDYDVEAWWVFLLELSCSELACSSSLVRIHVRSPLVRQQVVEAVKLGVELAAVAPDQLA